CCSAEALSGSCPAEDNGTTVFMSLPPVTGLLADVLEEPELFSRNDVCESQEHIASIVFPDTAVTGHGFEQFGLLMVTRRSQGITRFDHGGTAEVQGLRPQMLATIESKCLCHLCCVGLGI